MSYAYPDSRRYYELLEGKYCLGRYSITSKSAGNFFARQIFKLIADVQTAQTSVTVGLIGSPGSGKSYMTTELLKYAGKINVNYQGTHNTFEGVSAKFGQIARHDMWVVPQYETKERLKAFAKSQAKAKSILMVEHAQFSEDIAYDIVLTIVHRAASRELDITTKLPISQNPAFHSFAKKTASKAMDLGL